MTRPSDAPVLTDDLLNDLRERWVAHDVPIASAMNDGLTKNQLDTVEAHIGKTLPEELRVWWAWANGSDFGWDLHAGPWLLPVDQAIKRAEMMREIAEEVWAPDDPKLVQQWDPEWIPFTHSLPGGLLALATSRAAYGANLVMHIDNRIAEAPARVASHTIGQIVTWWISLYDTGGYVIGADGKWKLDESKSDDFPGPPRSWMKYAT